ncbi:MAG: CocE/NonD family hydrolase C-terminal non-catalytic domain-containing protein, partial [Pseudomonadota bacterium]
VVPGEVMTIDVPLHGVGHRLAVGHALVVQIASTYWPVLWPAPEPVTLTLQPGRSSLHLPTRAAVDDNPRPMPEPPRRTQKRPMTKVRDGAMERSLHTDLTTGEHRTRFYLDGGVFGPIGRLRLDDTGTEMGDISDRVYRITATDPLSCRATMDQESHFCREDWDARIKTTADMTASRTAFHLRASVTCWDGDTVFHTVEWEHEIPRNGM